MWLRNTTKTTYFRYISIQNLAYQWNNSEYRLMKPCLEVYQLHNVEYRLMKLWFKSTGKRLLRNLVYYPGILVQYTRFWYDIPGISIVIPGILIGILDISKISDFWNAIHMTLVQRQSEEGWERLTYVTRPII